MNYIIFDLEFNQGFKSSNENKNLSNPKCPFEIIQIGAIKLDESLKEIATMNSLVRPNIYTDINPYVKEITCITLDMVCNAKPFEEIYREFIKLTQGDNNILCVWGMGDMKELFRNIKYYELDTTHIPKECINLQRHASKYFNCPKGINIGLQNAAELLTVSPNGQFHDAFNDAFYTAEIFKKLYSKNMKPIIYNFHNQFIRRKTENKKVDYNKLIEQFEKMYNREMTEEEQSIIKLAYKMGKTNQFQY